MEIYTTGIVLMAALILLPIVWTSLTMSMTGGIPQEAETNRSTPLPQKVLQMMLFIAGVERNPGTEPEIGNVLQGHQCKFCGGVFK